MATQPPARPEVAPQGDRRRFSPRTASIYFLGVLLAITLKATYDTFFKGMATLDSMSDAWNQFHQSGDRNTLFLFQFLIYLFTLFRFYWGSYRYFRTEPQVEGPKNVLVDLIAVILLFSGFYVSGITVKTTYLFYYSIVLFHLLDLCWFWSANLILIPKESIRRVIFIWMTFDGITIASFLIWKALDFFYPVPDYRYQYFALSSLLVVGLGDFWKLWDFYADTDAE